MHGLARRFRSGHRRLTCRTAESRCNERPSEISEPSVSKHVFYPRNDSGWLVNYGLCQFLQLFPAHRLNFHLALLGFVQELRVGHGFCVCSAQDFYPFFRRAWRHHPGPAKVAAAQNHVGDATALFRGLFFLEDFVDRRSLWNPRIPLLPPPEPPARKPSSPPTPTPLPPDQSPSRHPPALPPPPSP